MKYINLFVATLGTIIALFSSQLAYAHNDIQLLKDALRRIDRWEPERLDPYEGEGFTDNDIRYLMQEAGAIMLILVHDDEAAQSFFSRAPSLDRERALASLVMFKLVDETEFPLERRVRTIELALRGSLEYSWIELRDMRIGSAYGGAFAEYLPQKIDIFAHPQLRNAITETQRAIGQLHRTMDWTDRPTLTSRLAAS